MSFLSNWLRADSYKDQQTGIEFPEKIGLYKRGKITPYEVVPKEAGVAIEYRSEDAEVTVYVRAPGDGVRKTSAEHLNEALAGIKALETQGKYSNVKIYDLSADKEKSGWKSAAFTSKSTNHFLVSFIHCKVTSGYLVKIRATTGNIENDQLKSFIVRLQDVIDTAPKKT